MRTSSVRACLAVLLLLAASPGSAAVLERDPAGRTAFRRSPVRGSVSGLPSRLEPNLGQARPGVDVVARAPGLLALLSGDGIDLVAAGGAAAVGMRFEGAAPRERWIPVDPTGGCSHTFRGRGAALRSIDAPQFLGATLAEPWPGITASFRSEGDALAWGFRLAPGIGGERLRLRFEGADAVEVDDGGRLRVLTPRGEFRHSAPVAWQESGGRRIPVEARFVRTGTRSARIALGPASPGLPVEVDPRIDFLSMGGGSGDEAASWNDLDNSVIGGGHVVAAGDDGDLYLTGSTASADFPAVGTFPSETAGNYDLFVARLDALTHDVLWTAFLGSPNNDIPAAVAVDADGRAIVAGQVLGDGGFPVTEGALQPVNGGVADAVLFRIAADGSSLDFCTYFGGSSGASPSALAVAPDGSFVMAGSTWSGGFSSSSIPLKNPLQNQNMGAQDAFIARFQPDGSDLEWATYWGGGKHEYCYDVAIDGEGDVLVSGMTLSTNFPVVGTPLQASAAGGYDAFLAKFAGDGTSCVFSTYLGGSADDVATSIAPGDEGSFFFGGGTLSSNFPLKNPLQASSGGGLDGVLGRVDAAGSALTLGWSTYLGGSAEDRVQGIAVMENGRVVAGGETLSDGFPVTSDAAQATRAGLRDCFVARFDPAGTSRDYSTFLGGTGTDRLRGLVVSEGKYVVVGGATSLFGIAKGKWDFGTQGGTDAWIGTLTWVPISPVGLAATPVNSSTVDLAWTDRSADETSFTVERARVGQPWFPIVSLPPNTQAWTDPGTLGAAEYLYRVRAESLEGFSRWSEEAPVTTPPGPPGAPLSPGDPVVTVLTPRSVRVDWEDRSDSEDFFLVSGRKGQGPWSTLATPSAGVTTFTQGNLLSGRTYSYALRAGNSGGLSPATAPTDVTLPSTVEATLVKGLIKDSASAGKDKLKVSGTMTLAEGAASTVLEPALADLEFRFGDWEGAVLLRIPAGDEGWKLKEKKGRWTWKSPKGSVSRASLVIYPETGAFTLAVSRFTLPSAPANPVLLSIGVSSDGGSVSGNWTEKKGTWKYPSAE